MLSIELIAGKLDKGDHLDQQIDHGGKVYTLESIINEAKSIKSDYKFDYSVVSMSSYMLMDEAGTKKYSKSVYLRWFGKIAYLGDAEMIEIGWSDQEPSKLNVHCFDTRLLPPKPQFAIEFSSRLAVNVKDGTTLSKAFADAADKVNLAGVESMVPKCYAFVQKDKNGYEKRISSASCMNPGQKEINRELTKIRQQKYIDGDIYVVQYMGEGRNRLFHGSGSDMTFYKPIGGGYE